MTFEAAFTLSVVVVTLVALAQEWLAPDLVLMGSLAVVTAGGVLELEAALQGFADPTLLAIGSLFVVAAGLRATGVLRKAAALLFGRGGPLSAVLARLTSATAVSSAFLNNTPIVAMGIPAVLSWARERGVSPAKLLIPLSYASILGGVCTLLGTSTNLVADGLLRSSGMEGLGFFELARVGVPMGLVGIGYLVFVAPRLLPEHGELRSEGTKRGALANNVHLYRVPGDSLAVGRTVEEAGLSVPELHLVRMIRDDGTVVQIRPDTTVRPGDLLTFQGTVDAMEATADRLGLYPAELEHPEPLEGAAELREAVIPEGSELTASRVDGINFVERYGASVLGVVRGGRHLDEVGDVVLRPGDTLLLLTREGFEKAYEESKDFHLVGGSERDEPGSLDPAAVWKPTKAKAGLAVLAAIVGLAAFGVVHISLAALGGALVMVGLGFLSPAEARRSVDWSVLLVIGAAIGLGVALQESGGADMVAQWIVALGEPFGPRGILAALLVASMVFTLVITNNAAVAILFPVATSVAAGQGLDPRPFVIAVTVAASLAFATPVGYQTNLMVYGPGGYEFKDYVRAGLPLQLVVAILGVVLIPYLWSF